MIYSIVALTKFLCCDFLQIRKSCKDRAELKDIKALLKAELEEANLSYRTLCTTEDQSRSKTAEFNLERELTELSLRCIPQMIRRVCTDYERYSQRKRKSISGLRSALLEQEFFVQQRCFAQRECATLQNVRREALFSRGEFATGERERLRGVLEVEEMKLAYLTECLKDSAHDNTTPNVLQCGPPASRCRTYIAGPSFGQTRVNRVESQESPALADPFADWERRSDHTEHTLEHRPVATRGDGNDGAIAGYTFRYPNLRHQRSAEYLECANEITGIEEGGSLEGTDPTAEPRNVATSGSVQVTVSTTTVTEVSYKTQKVSTGIRKLTSIFTACHITNNRPLCRPRGV
jgi:hypothetical protein